MSRFFRRRRVRLPDRADWGVASVTAGVALLGGYAARSVLPPLAGRVVEGALGAASLALGATLDRQRRGNPALALGLAAGGIASMGRALWGESAAVIEGFPSTINPALIAAIYGSDSDALGSEIEQAASLLQLIRPPGVMLHSSYEALATNGNAHTVRVQAILPGCEVWWGVTDDEDYARVVAGGMTAAQVLGLRASVGRAAAVAGIPYLIWDAERNWTHGVAGFDETAATQSINSVKQLAGAPRQGLTTYPAPTLHGDFPWQGFNTVEVFMPTIYWGQPDYGSDGPTQLNVALSSIQDAYSQGLLGASEAIVPYLLMHGCTIEDLGFVADHFAQIGCWTLLGGDTADANGQRFMLAMTTLDRLGFKGVGRIAAFQTSRGLTSDSILGPETLGALGV